MAGLTSKVFDAIVVGAGGAHGSAALYHLAKRGAQVLGLEAQPSAPHDRGSSHGLTRIIRKCYFEHPSYVPLLHSSYQLWHELEAETGEKLLTLTGCVNTSAPGSQCGPGLACFEGSLLAAQQHNLEHEILSPAQVAQRFPAYRLPEGFQSLYEPGAGFLAPEKCIAAHLGQAQKSGAQLVCGAAVQRWAVEPPAGGSGSGSGSGGGLVRVETSQGTFQAKTLVLAAGGWMPALVPELQPLLTVERQVVGWFEVAPEQRDAFHPSRCPVFLLQDPQGNYFYGFPADEHGFKVGKYHHLREKVTPDGVPRDISPQDEEALRQCLQYFPGAQGGRLTRAAVCLFTNTPDLNFILDRHPRHPQVVLSSACSGHGFKFSSVVGSVLADLALNEQGTTPHDISLHRLSRDRLGQAAIGAAHRSIVRTGEVAKRAACSGVAAVVCSQGAMSLKSAYLFLYNTTLSLAWGYVLFLTYQTSQAGGGLQDVWQAVELPLKVAQTAAVMEVVHSAVGLVRSPVAITATQVASRLFILWGVVDLVPATRASPLVLLRLPLGGGGGALQLSLVTLLTAWCCSEVIRYSFFAFKELGMQPYVLLWLRYTAFLILYPLGVGSELAMVALALPTIRANRPLSIQLPNAANFGFDYYWACWLAVLAYLPGFPQLYFYMLAQRRKARPLQSRLIGIPMGDMDGEDLYSDFGPPVGLAEEEELRAGASGSGGSGVEPMAAEAALDLYADLLDGGGEGGTLLKTQVAELSDRVQRQEAQIAALQQQVEALTEENGQLSERCAALTSNISCLFNTAKLELARKDEAIKELRERWACLVNALRLSIE
ncbi:N-methyltryptophan oxidase isoform A [Chlorella sorokiniana]|uniref:very-long-chain (3R)-3-hydroxyacyl-CoA dehydratase n=1 Tax=Chlorella sorokiniana TaxID=3076 RepID=A0A2P6TXH3_CHLSO|nr:N-methyltryptophan oxidase isoform A [Chlorella sorokiniana]|eukprot:PRW58764.1 N-methyltryptophan oxidase isoform A [Chlorella sorokiniana]